MTPRTMDAECFANCAVTQLAETELEERMIKRQSGGQLYLSTGAIVACDPLVQPERPSFARMVAPGRYPVTFYSRFRLGMVELRFGDEPVVRWELATLPGQDVGALKPNEIFGYSVDAGVGCFMDGAVHALMQQREAQVCAEGDAEDFNYYDNVLATELETEQAGYSFEWCDHHPIADDPRNAIIFTSGWGDGHYPSFWGLAADGRAVLLVTDFLVFDNADARSDDELATARRIASMPPAHREAMNQAHAAIEADNLSLLESLLVSGNAHPEWFTPHTGETLTGSAVRLDKPDALRLLIRYGARAECPDFLKLETKKKVLNTYLDFARWYRQGRSQELLRLLERELK